MLQLQQDDASVVDLDLGLGLGFVVLCDAADNGDAAAAAAAAAGDIDVDVDGAAADVDVDVDVDGAVDGAVDTVPYYPAFQRDTVDTADFAFVLDNVAGLVDSYADPGPTTW